MKRLGLVVLLASLTLVLGAGRAFAADYVIKLGHVIAPSEAIHQAFERMGQRVKERTKGRVEIQVYPNSQLGSNKDTYEQARMGAPVMVHIDPGYASELGDTDIAIVKLFGEHDMADSEELSKILHRVLGARDLLIVDLSEAEFIDSSILNSLIAARRTAFGDMTGV